MAGPYSIGSGKTYTTIAAWESDTQQDMNGIGELRGECYGAYNAFDESVNMDGCTNTSAADFRHLTAASGEEHSGKHETGVGIDNTTTTDAQVIGSDDPFDEISWLEVRGHSDQNTKGVLLVRDDAKLHHAIIRRTQDAVQCQRSDNVIYRNVLYDVSDDGIICRDGTICYNNTIYDCADDGFVFLEDDAGTTIKNNHSTGNAGVDYGGFGVNIVHADNMDEDSSGDETISGTPAQEFTSVTGGSEDFHLLSGATAVDAGANLGSPYDYDIDNVQVSGTWDSGADEYVAVGGVAPTSTILGPLFGPLGGPV
ncbi:MAG: right-handed parallel beta-helix repeat-containing protein [Candidatus Thorarchaeota archaeon]|jgi:hypothetical protein